MNLSPSDETLPPPLQNGLGNTVVQSTAFVDTDSDGSPIFAATHVPSKYAMEPKRGKLVTGSKFVPSNDCNGATASVVKNRSWQNTKPPCHVLVPTISHCSASAEDNVTVGLLSLRIQKRPSPKASDRIPTRTGNRLAIQFSPSEEEITAGPPTTATINPFPVVNLDACSSLARFQVVPSSETRITLLLATPFCCARLTTNRPLAKMPSTQSAFVTDG